MADKQKHSNRTGKYSQIGAKTLLVAVTILAVFGYAVTTVEAQPRGRRGGPEGEMRAPRGAAIGMMLRRLDLSQDQRQQLRAVLEQNAEVVRSGSDRLRVARQALQEAVVSDSANEEEIRSLATDLGAIAGEVGTAAAALRGQVRELLTPEQRARMTEMEQFIEDRGRRPGRVEPRGGKGPRRGQDPHGFRHDRERRGRPRR